MASLASRDIRFRASHEFRTQLAERASQWGVSNHEAAKRLSVLAAYDLTTTDHSRVAMLANRIGGTFAAAAATLTEKRSQ